MRRFVFAAALFAAVAGCSQRQAGAGEEARERSLLLTGAAIVDADAVAVSEPKDVLIIDGVIREVTGVGEIDGARAAQTVDASGLFLSPGLIDGHAHVGDGGLGINTDGDRIAAMAQFVRYGVTAIFVPGGTGGNDEQLAEWKDRCASGKLVCPRVFGSGDLITAPDSHPIGTIMEFPPDATQADFHKRGVMALAEDEPAEPMIAAKAAAGVDAIKIVIEDGPLPWYPRPRLSKEKVKDIVDAAHAHDLRVFAHVSLAEHVVDGVEAGVDGFMHSAETPIPEATLEEMARRGVFYLATLSLHDGLMDDALGGFKEEPYAAKGVSAKAIESLKAKEREGGISQEELAEWKNALASNLLAVRDAGALLALGTDVNNPTVYPGYSAHEELALMVEAGLTPAEALNAATRGGAAFLGREGELGRIAPGYRADMIATRANPLDDILNTRTLEFVVLNGAVRRDVVSADD
ncbi:MAG: amidohydrolase family protein [Amphiplicatus sp.]